MKKTQRSSDTVRVCDFDIQLYNFNVVKKTVFVLYFAYSEQFTLNYIPNLYTRALSEILMPVKFKWSCFWKNLFLYINRTVGYCRAAAIWYIFDVKIIYCEEGNEINYLKYTGEFKFNILLWPLYCYWKYKNGKIIAIIIIYKKLFVNWVYGSNPRRKLRRI